MGLNRDRRHKRRPTGGRMPIMQCKRKYERGSQPAMTKIGTFKVKQVRRHGGNIKNRALRLEKGAFAWVSEKKSASCRINQVVYNAVSNELVRTNTLTKGSIVSLDPAVARGMLSRRYGLQLNKDRSLTRAEGIEYSPIVQRLQAGRTPELCPHFTEQLARGRVYGKIASRPGQVGKADGYFLEGDELAFYLKRINKK